MPVAVASVTPTKPFCAAAAAATAAAVPEPLWPADTKLAIRCAACRFATLATTADVVLASCKATCWPPATPCRVLTVVVTTVLPQVTGLLIAMLLVEIFALGMTPALVTVAVA